MKKSILFVWTLTLVCALQTNAATITVRTSGGDFTSVAAAIAAATDGDIIDVLGTFTESGLTITKSITLQGHGMNNTVIQGNATMPTSGNYTALTRNGIFWIGSAAGGASLNITVAIKNMTIQNGVTPSSGGRAGGITVNRIKGKVTLLGLKLADNWGESSSSQVTGGIFCQGSNLDIDHCWINGNTAYTANSPFGGGMQLATDYDSGNPGNANNGVVNIRSTTISNNYCSTGTNSNGGGIAIITSTGTAAGKNIDVLVENSTIYGNVSKSNGNGIYVRNITLNEAGTGFGTNNAAVKLTVNHSTIVNNSTASTSTSGMGINFNDGTGIALFSMNNSIVMGNYTTNGGGTAATTTQTQIFPGSKFENVAGGVTNSITRSTSFSNISGYNVQVAGTSPYDYTGLAFSAGLSSDSIPVLKIGSGSSAKDFVSTNYLASPLTTDQLGNSRVGNTDAGAYEYGLIQTINFASLPADKTVGDADFDPGATSATSEVNPISYESSNIQVATIVNNNIHIISHGTTTITASQTGNSDYYAAAPVSRVLTISQRPVITLSTGEHEADIITAPKYDVVVNGAATKLIINESKTVNSIFLGDEAQLTIDSNNTLSVNEDLIIKAGKTGSSALYLDGDISLSGDLLIQKTIDKSKWYFISFPTDVPINQISQVSGSGVLGELGTNWWIKYYDGASRTQNLGTESNWKNMLSSQTLQGKKGYIIGISNDLDGDYVLEFKLNKNIVSSPEMSGSVDVTNYGEGVVAANHVGWNLVGSPYFSKFNPLNLGVNYLTIHNGISYSQYAKTEAVDIIPFSSFFVQASTSGTGNQLAFDLIGRRSIVSQTGRSDDYEVKLLINNGSYTDHTNILLNNHYTTGYEINRDLEKWLTTNTLAPQIYSIVDGVRYAYNALSYDNAGNIPIGIYNRNGGTATISAQKSYLVTSGQLLLFDTNTGQTTNLYETGYSYLSAAGFENNRFILNIKNTTTKLPVDTSVIKFKLTFRELQLSGLNIGVNVVINDMAGQSIVVYNAKDSGCFNYLFKSGGVYIITVSNDQERSTIKIVVN